MGIPSITSNLSGFGCYMEEHVENPCQSHTCNQYVFILTPLQP